MYNRINIWSNSEKAAMRKAETRKRRATPLKDAAA